MQMNQLPHIHTHALELDAIRFQKIATGEINFVCLPNLGFYEYDVLIFNETRNGIKTGLCLHVQIDSVEKIFHRGIDTNLVSIELHLVPEEPPFLQPEPFYDDEPKRFNLSEPFVFTLLLLFVVGFFECLYLYATTGSWYYLIGNFIIAGVVFVEYSMPGPVQ